HVRAGIVSLYDTALVSSLVSSRDGQERCDHGSHSPRSTSTSSRFPPYRITATPVTAAATTPSLPASSATAIFSLACMAFAPPAPTHNPEAWRGRIKFTFTTPSAILGGGSFTPTKGDDHGIIDVIDTKHIEYPDSSKGTISQQGRSKIIYYSNTSTRATRTRKRCARATRHNPL
ncbi:hypothetical protein EDD22DRAFT_1000392, partial [Suillus occidentalis]